MTLLKALSDTKILNELLQKDIFLIHVFNKVNSSIFNTISKTPYVALIGAIIGQRISFVQARKLRSSLYQLLGTNFSPNDIDKHINELNFPSNVKQTITNVNTFIVEQQLDLNKQEDLEKIIKIPGIGPWTLNTTKLVIMKDDLDIFPQQDLFLRKKVKQLYLLPRIPTPKEMKQMALKWAPYRSIVCWYLWRWF